MGFAELLGDERCSSSGAVQEFLRPITTSGKPKDKLWDGWTEFVKIVSTTPHDQQDRLVDFMIKLRAEPASEGSLDWKILPDFGPAMRHAWNDFEQNETWVSKNAFCARLTAQSKQEDVFDFSLYGIWALRPALEDKDLGQELASSTELQAAAVWMVYASKVLWKRSVDEQKYDGKMAREGDSLKGKEWRGYSEERWSVWKERFQKAVESTEDEETKTLLQEAVSKMKQV